MTTLARILAVSCDPRGSRVVYVAGDARPRSAYVDGDRVQRVGEVRL